MKTLSSEKFIYLLMAYKLAKQSGGSIVVGKDNGFTDGHRHMRRFQIINHGKYELIVETKSSPSCTDFTRIFEVVETGLELPIIQEYVDENSDNWSKTWRH